MRTISDMIIEQFKTIDGHRDGPMIIEPTTITIYIEFATSYMCKVYVTNTIRIELIHHGLIFLEKQFDYMNPDFRLSDITDIVRHEFMVHWIKLSTVHKQITEND